MCPKCDHGCDFFKLSENCDHSRVSWREFSDQFDRFFSFSWPIFKGAHVFDNIATVIFAVLMSVWATLFLEGWKRYQEEIAWDWDLTNFESEEVCRWFSERVPHWESFDGMKRVLRAF